MELCSVLCASLDGKGVWERMDTRICLAESLGCSPETIPTLLIGYTPTQNKKFKKIHKLKAGCCFELKAKRKKETSS